MNDPRRWQQVSRIALESKNVDVDRKSIRIHIVRTKETFGHNVYTLYQTDHPDFIQIRPHSITRSLDTDIE